MLRNHLSIVVLAALLAGCSGGGSPAVPSAPQAVAVATSAPTVAPTVKPTVSPTVAPTTAPPAATPAPTATPLFAPLASIPPNTWEFVSQASFILTFSSPYYSNIVGSTLSGNIPNVVIPTFMLPGVLNVITPFNPTSAQVARPVPDNCSLVWKQNMLNGYNVNAVSAQITTGSNGPCAYKLVNSSDGNAIQIDISFDTNPAS